MKSSKVVLTFTSIFITLVPGIINHPMLTDYGGFFESRTYKAPTSLISGTQQKMEYEIAIRAENLQDRDWSTKTDDSICYTYIQSCRTYQWIKIHETETIQDDPSPVFAQKLVVSSLPTENTTMKFEIRDSGLAEKNILGTAITHLGTLLSSGTFTLPIQKRNSDGTPSISAKAKIIISAERLIDSEDKVMMTISGANLAKKYANLYLELFKVSPGQNNFVLVYRTELRENQQENVKWKQFSIPMKNLCNGHLHRALIFVGWDSNPDVGRTMIGQFQTSLHELRDGGRTDFQLSSQTSKGHRAERIIVKLDYIHETEQQAVPADSETNTSTLVPNASTTSVDSSAKMNLMNLRRKLRVNV